MMNKKKRTKRVKKCKLLNSEVNFTDSNSRTSKQLDDTDREEELKK